MRRVDGHVFPQEGITNELLHNITKSFTAGDYKGLYSVEDIPSELAAQNRFVIIVNLASKRSVNPGHFVVIGARPKKVYYFDSYGIPPLQEDVTSFLDHCKREIMVCKYQIQPTNSALCPLYAMYIALYLDWYPWEKRMRDLSAAFDTKDLTYNDKVIGRYVGGLIECIADRRRRGLGRYKR